MTLIKKAVIQAGISVGLLLAGTTLPAMAQNTVSNSRQGLPGRRVSGGTRSDCMANSPAPIVALNPESNLSKTMSDRPSLHFVVPALDRDYPLEFSLRDAEGNRVYEASFSSQEQQGVLGIQLPAQLLQANQDYRWYLSIVCDAQDPSQNDVLFGALRLVDDFAATHLSAPLSVPTANSTIEDDLTLAQSYQAAGLWSDAVDVVASLREQHPDNGSVRQSWRQLLQALDVEHVVEPVVAAR